MKVVQSKDVKAVIKSYPQKAQKQLMLLRELILETANEIEGLKEIEETLKWGEPSYLAKNGSTLRMDWKEKSPDQVALYFKCTSRLVPTFKLAFSETFRYEGNRAIIFQLDEEIPVKEVKSCIKSTLTYHKVKHLKLLGIE